MIRATWRGDWEGMIPALTGLVECLLATYAAKRTGDLRIEVMISRNVDESLSVGLEITVQSSQPHLQL